MSTRSGGPKSAKGKAVSRMNATRFGIYSVTPVVPAFEREADWQAHRTGIFDDLQPEGYMQEIIAERIALKTWRLRRLVRYEREQIRNRQRRIPEHLAVSSFLAGRKPGDDEQKSFDLIDRWAMNALIPGEKELAILMRWEGRLTRELRLDMLHLEHMQRQRREERRTHRSGSEPILTLAQPEPQVPPDSPSLGDPVALRCPELPTQSGQSKDPAEEPVSHPLRGHAERDRYGPAVRPAEEPESLGDSIALRRLN